MSRRNRLQKTQDRKLRDLDDHLHFLKEALVKVANGDDAYLKHLATELRVLVCKSSGTEGLLWRIIDLLSEKEQDAVHVHLTGKLNREHPIGKLATFTFSPIFRAGHGDPRIPARRYSLKGIIKESEALVVSGIGYTHEKLIRAVAEQMGSAHEDEGAESYLVELDRMSISNSSILTTLLLNDAELVLGVGDRVLDSALKKFNFVRKTRPVLVIPTYTRPAPYVTNTNFEFIPGSPPREGSLLFALNISPSDWSKDGYSFDLVSQGPISINTMIHPDATIELRVQGLSDSIIETRKKIPTTGTDLDHLPLGIAFTWNGSDLAFYVRGVRIDTIQYEPATSQ